MATKQQMKRASRVDEVITGLVRSYLTPQVQIYASAATLKIELPHTARGKGANTNRTGWGLHSYSQRKRDAGHICLHGAAEQGKTDTHKRSSQPNSLLDERKRPPTRST